MNPIVLNQNFNPKNQLSFLPFQPEPLYPAVSPLSFTPAITSTIKQQETKEKQNFKNPNKSFYQEEIERLNCMNSYIMAQLSAALQQKKVILRLIAQAEKQEKSEQQIDCEKRVRRCAKDIEKKHRCPEQDCQKSYGTEGSLFQHIRLKHPKVNSHDPPLMLDPA